MSFDRLEVLAVLAITAIVFGCIGLVAFGPHRDRPQRACVCSDGGR